MPRKANPDPLEKDIEKKVCEYAKSLGVLVYKFTSPAKRSVPDRLFITPKGTVFFIEFKRLGKDATPAQKVEIEKLRKQHAWVGVIDNTANGKLLVNDMLNVPSASARFDADNAFNTAKNKELVDFKAALEKHDWHYDRSDDPRAYGRGAKEEHRLAAFAKEHGEAFESAYAKARAKAMNADDPMLQ